MIFEQKCMYVDNGAFSYNPIFNIIKAGAICTYMATTIADSSAISTSSINTTYSTPFSGCILSTNVLKRHVNVGFLELPRIKGGVPGTGELKKWKPTTTQNRPTRALP